MFKSFYSGKMRLVAVGVIIAVLVIGLFGFLQTGKVAEAAILTPTESPALTTVFSDDFSGDLSQWTVISGTWAIETGELSQNSTLDYPNIVAGSSWTNFVAEARIKNVDSTAIGLITRYIDENNYIVTYYFFAGSQKDKIAVWDKVGGNWNQVVSYTFAKTANNDVWYNLTVSMSGNQIEVYLDEGLVTTGNTVVTETGKIGLTSHKGHSHFDDIEVRASPVPTTYDLKVREKVTKIVITCAWTGSGNITIANLTSPTTTYYETDMEIYEKTTLPIQGTTSISNIKRALLTITAPVSLEIWTLYLDLEEVNTCQLSAETY